MMRFCCKYNQNMIILYKKYRIMIFFIFLRRGLEGVSEYKKQDVLLYDKNILPPQNKG